MRIQPPKRKLVYPLREVCQMTGLSDRTIKRWEKVFPALKPIRNRAANRHYLERDVEMIFYIRYLIYEEKLSEEEVKERLKHFQPGHQQDHPAYLKRLLAEIKMEIQEIQRLLES